MADRRNRAATELRTPGVSDGVTPDAGAAEAEYECCVREVIESSVQNRDLERAIEARKSIERNVGAVLEALSKERAEVRGRDVALRFRAARAARDRPILVRAPRVICAGLFRRLLRPADYKRLVEPTLQICTRSTSLVWRGKTKPERNGPSCVRISTSCRPGCGRYWASLFRVSSIGSGYDESAVLAAEVPSIIVTVARMAVVPGRQKTSLNVNSSISV